MDLETKYPTKIDTQNATRDNTKAKALAPSQELADATLSCEDKAGTTSIGTQSQLTV